MYKYNASGVYQNVSFSTLSQDNYPAGITWDGTYFWVIGGNSGSVYKYNASGVYQSVSFSVASEETSPRGISFDGTNLWVIGYSTDSAYKYADVNGISPDTSFGAHNYVRVK